MRSRQRLEQIHLHPHFPLALEITRRLRPAETVLAGGSVRDALLGVAPKDLDLATAAPPDVVEATFPRTVDVGRAFGTIVVVDGAASLEVTTFRREDEYLDGRRPSGVVFTNAEEDARRRDFTVNALFYEPETETLIDYVGGVADLRDRLLRTVGVAERRFTEDHLRMLRAVRFVAQLGFRLDDEAQAAIRALRGHLATVAAERTLAEMKRLLMAPHRAAGLELAARLGVLEVIWPECDLSVGGGVLPSWESAFAHFTPAGAAARLKTWRASRESQRRVAETRRGYELLTETTGPAARLRVVGGEFGGDVIALARARGVDVTADLARLAEMGGTLPRPFVTGEDLKAIGHPPGRAMGELLDRLYDDQLEGRVTDRASALAAAARP